MDGSKEVYFPFLEHKIIMVKNIRSQGLFNSAFENHTGS